MKKCVTNFIRSKAVTRATPPSSPKTQDANFGIQRPEVLFYRWAGRKSCELKYIVPIGFGLDWSGLGATALV